MDGFGHELVNRPDVVVPLIGEFLDRALLSKLRHVEDLSPPQY